MKRLPPKHDYAMPVRVAEMWERFEYPQLPQQIPFEVGGGGGAMTVQVAAADASDISKRKADVQASGVADEGAILAANAMGGDDARILLSEGRFVLNPNRLTLGAGCHLQGMGRGTVIETSATAGTIVSTDADGIVSDLTIQRSGPAVNTLIGIESALENQILRCRFQNLDVGVDVAGSNTQVRGCTGDTTATFVDVSGQAESCVIANNSRVQRIFLSGGFYTVVEGNTILSETNGIEVEADDAAGLVIANNTINCDLTGILLDGLVLDSVVVGNTLVNITTGIHVNNGVGPCQRILVAANMIGVEGFIGEDGIILDAALDSQVHGNLVYNAGQNTTNTFDGIRASGDRNSVLANTVVPASVAPLTRYGINIAGGNDNAAYANYLGQSALYGTADSVDSGTGTQTSPAAGAIGGQFAF